MAGIVVPLYPGVYSAIGLLMSDVKHDYVQSRMTPLAALSPGRCQRAVRAARSSRRPTISPPTVLRPTRIRVERGLDLRYAGQGYEITLPCPADAITRPTRSPRLRRDFDAQHRTHVRPRRAGGAGRGRVLPRARHRPRAAGRTAAVQAGGHVARPGAARDAARCASTAQTIDCPVYQRERLDVGLTVAGPAVLDQFDCTTVLCPGQVARVDEWKNLIVTMEG